MIQMILVSLLSPFFATAPVQLASVKPCIWPNRCGATVTAPAPLVIAQFKPCVFPNPCGKTPSAV